MYAFMHLDGLVDCVLWLSMAIRNILCEVMMIQTAIPENVKYQTCFIKTAEFEKNPTTQTKGKTTTRDRL